MSDAAKIKLSNRELAIVVDTDFILTKQKIIQQVCMLFELQIPSIQQLFKNTWKEHVSQDSVPKISKGEQYRQLPYVVMDYPALFEKTDRFAIRTLFWWGDAFSVTLQLAGKYKLLFLDNMAAQLIKNQSLPFYIGINEREWEHHFEEDNYQPLASFTPEELYTQLHQLPHIKIALRYPVAQWNNMEQHFTEAYQLIAALVKKPN